MAKTGFLFPFTICPVYVALILIYSEGRRNFNMGKRFFFARALKKNHRKKNDSLKMSEREKIKEKMSPKGMFFDDNGGFASMLKSPFLVVRYAYHRLRHSRCKVFLALPSSTTITRTPWLILIRWKFIRKSFSLIFSLLLLVIAFLPSSFLYKKKNKKWM